MASGCPLLRRFQVEIDYNQNPKMTGDQFSRLVKALPNVEVLSLPVVFDMTTSELGDLADSCPRLTILDLVYARLHLSLNSLIEALPLSQLEEWGLDWVEFDDPSSYERLSSLQQLAETWNRVFPRIWQPPCYMDRTDPEKLIEEDILDEDEYECVRDQFEMRRRLWKLLGYAGLDSDVISNLLAMWETDFEIKTFGWPVIPMESFSDSKRHSSPE